MRLRSEAWVLGSMPPMTTTLTLRFDEVCRRIGVLPEGMLRTLRDMSTGQRESACVGHVDVTVISTVRTGATVERVSWFLRDRVSAHTQPLSILDACLSPLIQQEMLHTLSKDSLLSYLKLLHTSPSTTSIPPRSLHDILDIVRGHGCEGVVYAPSSMTEGIHGMGRTQWAARCEALWSEARFGMAQVADDEAIEALERSLTTLSGCTVPESCFMGLEWAKFVTCCLCSLSEGNGW